MKRIVQAFLASMFLATSVFSAPAQQALQPVVRLSNFIEVGNDVFMHILASSDIRYKTVQNYDFDRQHTRPDARSESVEYGQPGRRE